jgi:hypothetical protein
MQFVADPAQKDVTRELDADQIGFPDLLESAKVVAEIFDLAFTEVEELDRDNAVPRANNLAFDLDPAFVSVDVEMNVENGSRRKPLAGVEGNGICTYVEGGSGLHLVTNAVDDVHGDAPARRRSPF